MNEKEDLISQPLERSDYKIFEKKIGNDLLTLKYKEFLPEKNGEISSEKAIIFCGGAFVPENPKKPTYIIEKTLSELSGLRTFAFLDRTKRVVDEPLLKNAQVIQLFIKERNLKEVVLVGHSEGSVKMVNLAAILEKENPEVKIKGLILLDPVGLTSQGKLELPWRFVKTGIFDSKSMLKKEKERRIQKPGFWEEKKKEMEIIGSDLSDYVAEVLKNEKNKIIYLKRLWREIDEMRAPNPRPKEIKAPVVGFQGNFDIVSRPWEINFQELFPKSFYVRRIRPDKWGVHGVPIFRAKQMIKAAFYFLEKANKTDKSL